MISRWSRPEEAAAEAEAERGGRLHLVGEGGVVEPEPAHGGAQGLEVGGVHREQAAEHHGLRRLEAGQRLGAGLGGVGDRVADAGVGDLLDLRGDEAHLARPEAGGVLHLGGEDADAVDLVARVGRHHQHALALLQRAVEHAHQHDHAEVGIVPGVDEQRLERGRRVAFRRGEPLDDGLQHEVDADAGLGRDRHGVGRIDADDVLDLLLDALGLGGRQVDLVQHGHDLVAGVDGGIDVGQRLGLDALGGVDHEQRALAGGERAADLVAEVDVAGRVHEVEDVGEAVLRLVLEPHRLRLDGDAALALDVHGIEHLLAHVAQSDRAGALDQAVGERRLAVVDMRDDGEVADVVERCGGHGAA